MADILQTPFTMQLFKWKLHTQIEISLTFVPEIPFVNKSEFVEMMAESLVDNKLSLVHMMVCHRTVVKSLKEPLIPQINDVYMR